MQIVHIEHIVTALSINVLPQLLDVDRAWSTLHHHNNDVLDDWNRREEDNEGEEVGADGVCVPHRREEVDDDGRDDHTNAHQHVTEDVQVGGIYIDVALWFVMMMLVMVMLELCLMSLFIVQQVLFDLLIFYLSLSTLISMVVAMIVSMPVAMAMATATVLMSVMAVVMIMLVLPSQMIVTIA